MTSTSTKTYLLPIAFDSGVVSLPVPLGCNPISKWGTDALIKLEDNGLFKPLEHELIFGKPNGLSNIETFVIFFTNGDQVMGNPYLSFKTLTDRIHFSGLAGLGNLKLDNFIQLVQERFEDYDFIPENSWKPFYYLDFVSNWQCNWTEEGIRLVDKLITEEVPLNKVWELLYSNVPYSLWRESLDLPLSWLAYAYKERG